MIFHQTPPEGRWPISTDEIVDFHPVPNLAPCAVPSVGFTGRCQSLALADPDGKWLHLGILK
jgi:hypothetical protein